MNKSQWSVFGWISIVIAMYCFGMGLFWSSAQPTLLPNTSLESIVLYASLDISNNIAGLFGGIFFLLGIASLISGRLEKK
jgi:hypothetical protein